MAAVGSVTITRKALGGSLAQITLAWQSSAGGAVSGSPFTLQRRSIRQVKFVPASGGTQPSDQYDITLVDTSGVDVLFGAGANLSNATPAMSRLSPAPLVDADDVVDLVVGNAGSAKAGTVVLWVE